MRNPRLRPEQVDIGEKKLDFDDLVNSILPLTEKHLLSFSRSRTNENTGTAVWSHDAPELRVDLDGRKQNIRIQVQETQTKDVSTFDGELISSSLSKVRIIKGSADKGSEVIGLKDPDDYLRDNMTEVEQNRLSEIIDQYVSAARARIIFYLIMLIASKNDTKASWKFFGANREA